MIKLYPVGTMVNKEIKKSFASYEKHMLDINNDLDNLIENNTSKVEKVIIFIFPRFIKKIFKIKNDKSYEGFFTKEHIKVFKSNKLIYDKVISY